MVDFSTIPVDKCRSHAERLLEQHRLPLGRCAGVGRAAGGGSRNAYGDGGRRSADLERLAPLMNDIAGRCTHMGPVGAGLAAKMINQLIVGVGMPCSPKPWRLCEKASIDAARIPECLGGGYADSN